MNWNLGPIHKGSGFSSNQPDETRLNYAKLEMNNMATSILGSKVYSQMFKCFNCGRKSVSLGYSQFQDNHAPTNVEDDELDESVVNEQLEYLEGLQDDWLATCTHCGWSDN